MTKVSFAVSIRPKPKPRSAAALQKTIPELVMAVQKAMEYAEGRLEREIEQDNCNLRRVVGHSSVLNVMSTKLNIERKRLNLR